MVLLKYNYSVPNFVLSLTLTLLRVTAIVVLHVMQRAVLRKSAAENPPVAKGLNSYFSSDLNLLIINFTSNTFKYENKLWRVR